jgi:CRISPR-associated protein Cmr4
MTTTTSTRAGRFLALHVQTPLHAGTGSGLGTVDLPIQRERHTQWPTIAGSALKGILRDVCREHLSNRKNLLEMDRFDDKENASEEDRAKQRKGTSSRRGLADATIELNLLFGPPTAGASEFAGSLSVTDARIVAFPVRSARGVFAWVSCPAALERLHRDAAIATQAPVKWEVPDVDERKCLAQQSSPCLHNGVALLEELDFQYAHEPDISEIATWITEHLIPAKFTGARQRFPKHFLVIPDDDFTYFVRHATEVSARIALDYDTKTVKGGALFYQEFLPAESLLYTLVLAAPSRSRRTAKSADAILQDLTQWVDRDVLQIGGDESTGKGLCAIQFA